VLIESARARAPGGPVVLDAEGALNHADRLSNPSTSDPRSQSWQH
jgi:hypothetical protein